MAVVMNAGLPPLNECEEGFIGCMDQARDAKEISVGRLEQNGSSAGIGWKGRKGIGEIHDPSEEWVFNDWARRQR